MTSTPPNTPVRRSRQGPTRSLPTLEANACASRNRRPAVTDRYRAQSSAADAVTKLVSTPNLPSMCAVISLRRRVSPLSQRQDRRDDFGPREPCAK